MKPFFTTLEKGCAISIGAALLMKFTHIPMYGILLIIACTTLAFLYVRAGLSDWVNKFGGARSFYLFAGLSFSFSCLAFLYKFMYWPWAGMMNFVAFFLVLTVWLLLRKRTESNFYSYLNFRTLILIPVIFLCAAIPRDRLIRMQHWNDKEFAELKIKHYDHPEDEKLTKQFREYKKN